MVCKIVDEVYMELKFTLCILLTTLCVCDYDGWRVARIHRRIFVNGHWAMERSSTPRFLQPVPRVPSPSLLVTPLLLQFCSTMQNRLRNSQHHSERSGHRAEQPSTRTDRRSEGPFAWSIVPKRELEKPAKWLLMAYESQLCCELRPLPRVLVLFR